MSYTETITEALHLMVPPPVRKALVEQAAAEGQPLRKFVGNILSEWWVVKVIAEEFPQERDGGDSSPKVG